jgi:hypothetical protein
MKCGGGRDRAPGAHFVVFVHKAHVDLLARSRTSVGRWGADEGKSPTGEVTPTSVP